MTSTQADVDRWAALVARAYAGACNPSLSAAEEGQLVRALRTPIADCIMLGGTPDAERVDPALIRWEAGARRKPGPRLGRVIYGRDEVTMLQSG